MMQSFDGADIVHVIDIDLFFGIKINPKDIVIGCYYSCFLGLIEY